MLDGDNGDSTWERIIEGLGFDLSTIGTLPRRDIGANFPRGANVLGGIGLGLSALGGLVGLYVAADTDADPFDRVLGAASAFSGALDLGAAGISLAADATGGPVLATLAGSAGVAAAVTSIAVAGATLEGWVLGKPYVDAIHNAHREGQIDGLRTGLAYGIMGLTPADPLVNETLRLNDHRIGEGIARSEGYVPGWARGVRRGYVIGRSLDTVEASVAYATTISEYWARRCRSWSRDPLEQAVNSVASAPLSVHQEALDRALATNRGAHLNQAMRAFVLAAWVTETYDVSALFRANFAADERPPARRNNNHDARRQPGSSATPPTLASFIAAHPWLTSAIAAPFAATGHFDLGLDLDTGIEFQNDDDHPHFEVEDREPFHDDDDDESTEEARDPLLPTVWTGDDDSNDRYDDEHNDGYLDDDRGQEDGYLDDDHEYDGDDDDNIDGDLGDGYLDDDGDAGADDDEDDAGLDDGRPGEDSYDDDNDDDNDDDDTPGADYGFA